jgi:membrane-bound lytic murein transglycosylase A
MQGIQAWARANPGRLNELLNANPSYVFFREVPNSKDGPIGALGVPLTAERSIAIDPRSVPLGVPVFLATTRPNTSRPLNRLVMAQDTGSAIKGAVRADYFWGFGKEAGEQAGRMKQSGRMWLLLPPEAVPK